ncbi:hypothetical protein PT300_09030 [Enterobacteriaceae bacterium ESL0689]|nr:hypothetical protein [Enterobacteriaceae bacterium ESL0689]
MLAFIPELLQPTQVVIDGHVVAQAYWQIVYYIAVMIASYFLNQALTKKVRNKTEAATADSWQFPQTDEGTPQCIFFGDCWTEDWQVLAYGNYRYQAIKK